MEQINYTMGELLKAEVKKQPTKEFLIYPDRDIRFTYREFDERVDEMALGFLSLGIKKGDHVGIWANNVTDWVTVMFATARIGAVLVTINTNYKTAELEYLISQADLKALCLVDSYRDSDYVQMVNELIPELAASSPGRLESKRFPKLTSVVFMGADSHRGMINTRALLERGQMMDPAAFDSIPLDCHEVINMQYTSGTTGFPKGVMLSHFNIINNGLYIGRRQNFSSNENLCLPVPLFHCFGIVLGVLAILTHGGTLTIMENFDPLKVLAAVEREKCTALYGVPTMFIAELNHPGFSQFDLSSLRTGIMAGSPCPEEIMRRVINEMHCRDITIAYGLTESSPVMTQTGVDDSLEVKVATVGRALEGVEVKVVNPETGRECAIDEQGELCCRGYNVMKGYYNKPEDTAAVIDADGWLHSGDLGIRRADGCFKVTGRIKDMIIRGGENIYPREIEEFLYRMPEIEDVQVAGIPDDKYGEVVGAFIKLKPGSELKEEDIKDFCRGQISRFKIPKHVLFVDAYPMTASGKIQKYKLGEIALDLLKISENAQ